MTTNDIDAIRKLTDAATDGPWRTGNRFGNRSLGSSVVVLAGNLPPVELDRHRNGRNDAEFIAAARTLVPALCDEVEQLRAERDAARDMANTARQEARQALHALDKARAVIEAAEAWREFVDDDGEQFSEVTGLIAAVDALPTANTDDQPCCGYRCQDNTTGVTA